MMINHFNNQPLVSIAIPTYQGEQYLSETLSCAISQTYPNIEILISDDGSTDTTLEIAQEFQEKSPFNFKILEHPRLGMVENWNYCLETAEGKYIKFLFQDDLILPNCLEKMVNLAEQDPELGLVFSPRDLLLVPEAENDAICMFIYQECDNLHKSWSKLQCIQSGDDLLNDPKLLENPMNKIGEPSTVLMRKEIFKKVGMFDPNLRQIVDVDMWLRIMGAYKIGFIEEPLSSFRIHPKQQSSLNQDTGESRLDFYRFCYKILTDPCYDFMPQKVKQSIYEQRIALIENEKVAFQKENAYFKEQLQHEQAIAMKLEGERVKAVSELVMVETLLHQAKERIEGMESSKFWKMRKAWFDLKRLLRLPTEE
jgi:GT2 family glycosyltransferase